MSTPALRIKRLTLTDFRAFPGPAPTHFEFDTKNLLVYGENGAGKSSIFHALAGFFSLKPMRPLRKHKNVFSGLPDADCRVAIEFTDGLPPVEWSVSNHPGSLRTKGADPRVTEAALRRALLDYRALLDTNYRHGSSPINLFDIAVETLLRDFPVTVGGGIVITIGELWEKVQHAKPALQTATSLALIRQACVEFNAAFRTAVAELLPLVNSLMIDLGWKDVLLNDLRTPGLTYKEARFIRDRIIDGQILTPDLSHRGHPLENPQSFLNEARLSALGLSIYLSGRLACIPSMPTQALKLLVLDDVLIGLDHSNRLPVLELLKTRFADWQIVLLTHDRIWFEMARFYLGNSGKWKCLEVFEGEDVARGIPSPTVRVPGDNSAAAALKQARAFLRDHHIPAAANYTRAAFELALKSFCQRFSVPVIYRTDPHELNIEKILSAVESWFNANSDKRCIAGVVERIRLFRKVVLNPYSHSAPPNIARAEVEGAISAVEKLLDVISVGKMEGDPMQAAQELVAKATPSTEEFHAALGFIRTSFFQSLQKFCERKRMNLKYRTSNTDVPTLWSAVLADRVSLFPSPLEQIPDQIEAERRWLISPVSESDLAALSHADLLRLVELLGDSGAGRSIFSR